MNSACLNGVINLNKCCYSVSMIRTIDNIIDQLNERAPKLLILSERNPLAYNSSGLPRYLNDVYSTMARLLHKADITILYTSYTEEMEHELQGNPELNYVDIDMGGPSGMKRNIDPRSNMKLIKGIHRVLPDKDLVDIHITSELPQMVATAVAVAHRNPLVISPHGGAKQLEGMSWKSMLFSKVVRNYIAPRSSIYALQSTDAVMRTVGVPALLVGNYTKPDFDKEDTTVSNDTLKHELINLIGSRRPLLQVGSLNDRKNQYTTLQAFNNLTDKNTHLIFVFANVELNVDERTDDVSALKGRSAYMDRLIEFTQQQDLQDRVTFYGAIPHADMPVLYKTVANRRGVALIPSTTEGLPGVLLESISAGLPPITSNRDGQADVITHGQNGYLINSPTDHGAIAGCINQLLADETTYDQVSTAAYVRSHDFSHDTFVKRIGLIYAHQLGLQIPQENGLPVLNGYISTSDHLVTA